MYRRIIIDAVPVDFTEQVDFTTAGSDYPTGYRVSKYEFSRKLQSGRNFSDANIFVLHLAGCVPDAG